MKTDRHLSRLRAPELGLGLGLGLTRPGGSGGGGAPWALPLWFTQAGYFPVQITSGPKVGTGNFTTSYNEAEWKDTGTTYYVATTGNDTTGDGTSGNPWKTLQKAHDTAAAGSIISVGAGVFANFTNSKNLSVIGAGRGSTFIGDLLTEADVTGRGSLTSGYQTVTLSSGALAGFVDLTKTRRVDYQGVAIPQVSYDCANAAAIATLRSTTTTIHDNQLYGTTIGTADPVAGIYRSSPTMGTSDARDTTGEMGATILGWKATAAAPVTLGGTSRLFMKNLSLVGGAAVAPPSGTTLVLHDCWRLGGTGDIFFVSGRIITYRGGARGCSIGVADIYDYEANSVGVEIDIYTDQCSGTGGDNNSTAHGALVLRANGLHRDGSRAINDVNGSISGDFGVTLGSSGASSAYTFASGGGGDCHTAGLRLLNKGSGYDYMMVESGTPNAHVYVYDNWIYSYVQGPPTSGTNISPTDRTGNRPTDDKTFFKCAPSSKDNLFTDAAGTIKVTATGQGVRVARDPTDPTQYVTFAAGQFTYEEDGSGRGLLRTVTGTNIGTGAFVLTGDAFDEDTTIIYNVKSSDTTAILMQAKSGNAAYIVDFRTGSDFKASSTLPPGFVSPNYTVHIDGSDTPITTITALRSGAFNGVRHNVTVRSANISWIQWLRASIPVQLNTDLYGFELFRTTSAAARQAREVAMAA